MPPVAGGSAPFQLYTGGITALAGGVSVLVQLAFSAAEVVTSAGSSTQPASEPAAHRARAKCLSFIGLSSLVRA